MPFYDYFCRNCLHKFEALHSIKTPDSEVLCPHCGRSGCCDKQVTVPGRAKVPGGSGASRRAW